MLKKRKSSQDNRKKRGKRKEIINKDIVRIRKIRKLERKLTCDNKILNNGERERKRERERMKER
jgi:hypothetical protein